MTKKKTKLDSIKTATGKTPKPRGRPKKAKKETKMDNLSFADGKQEEKIRKAKELEELVGLNQVNPYGTSIASVFEEKLNQMAIVDLQSLAVKVGVFPSGTQTSLKKKLKSSFRDYQRGSSSFVIPSVGGQILEGADRDSPAFKRALKLMKEGL